MPLVPANRRARWSLALIVLIGASGLVWFAFRDRGNGSPSGGGRGRDVILITLDTTRFDHLGCYGYERPTSPTIDRYAREGVRFDRAYAVAPITLPTHASILTGLAPPLHGARNNGTYKLGESATTLAEVLRGEGYRTGAFVSAFVLAEQFGLAQGFDEYDAVSALGSRDTAFSIPERRGTETVARALSWLDAQTDDHPVFLWVHLFDPHAPYDPPPEWGRQFGASARDRYDAEIRAMDAAIARLRSGLDQRGRDAITVIVADHGEGFGDHGEDAHGIFLYDETTRVPFILHAPGLLAPRVSDTVARQIDVMPTVLELLGHSTGDFPPDASSANRGMSMIPHLDDALFPAVYMETVMPFEDHGWSPLYALVRNGWKYIEAPRPELYDLSRDPGERDDRVREEPGRVESMSEGLERVRREATTSERVSLTGASRASLNAVGYVAGGGIAAESETLPDPKDVIDVLAQLETARNLLATRRRLDALELLTQVVERNPGNATALDLLGYQAIAEAKRREGADRERCLAYARRAFRGFLDRAPDRPDGPYGFALLAQESGDLDDALTRLDRVLTDHPDYLPALVTAMAIRLRAGDFGIARELGLRAIAVDPEHYEARYNLAIASHSSGESAEAIEHFERLYPGRSPSERSILEFWLAECRRALGEWRLALEHYQRVADPGLRRAKSVDALEAECRTRLDAMGGDG